MPNARTTPIFILFDGKRLVITLHPCYESTDVDRLIDCEDKKVGNVLPSIPVYIFAHLSTALGKQHSSLTRSGSKHLPLCELVKKLNYIPNRQAKRMLSLRMS